MDIAEIQRALKEEALDGWLFFDHHERDPLAYRVLGFQAPRTPTRRWYYFIPADGEPGALVHRIEPSMLDALPGAKTLYAGWGEQSECLRELLRECRSRGDAVLAQLRRSVRLAGGRRHGGTRARSWRRGP